MMSTSVIRVRNSHSSECQEMTLCTEFPDSRIRLLILRNNYPPVFGQVKMSELWDLAQNTFPESEEKFFQETRNVLSGKDTEFEFSLEGENFEWRKGIWTRGFIKVCQINEINVFSDLVQNFLLNLVNGKIDNSTIQAENEKLKNSLAYLKDRLEEMIEIKDSMEKKLYTQFLLILNTKKRKIRELQDEINGIKRKKENWVYDESTDTEISGEEGERTTDLKVNKVEITEIVENIEKPDLKGKNGMKLKAKNNVWGDPSQIIQESATVTSDEILNPKPSTSKQSDTILYEGGISSPPAFRKSPMNDRFAENNICGDPSQINRESATVTVDEFVNPKPSTSKQSEEILNKEVISSAQNVSRKSSLEDEYEFDDIINRVINVQPTASKRDAEISNEEISHSPSKISRQTLEFTESDDEEFELKDEGDSFEKTKINLTHLNITDEEPEDDLFSQSF